MTKRLRAGCPEILILCGGSLFIAMLWLSAYFEADIRWLHFFQSWLYVAAIALSWRLNRWGYFIGLTTAALWDYTGLFVNTFLRSGIHWLAVSIQQHHLMRADQVLAIPAWVGNFLVVVGSVWGYLRLPEKSAGDLVRVGLALVGTMAFFAADMALFQPRYLGMFRGLLHPHWP